MAIKSFIEKTDVVLFGVESFDYNGDGWNTIGSYIVSKLANDNQVLSRKNTTRAKNHCS